MKKYQVTDSRGEVHKRNSSRTYTHAVVAQTQVPSRTKVAWAGTERLANREAKRYHDADWTVEVLPAQLVHFE